MLVFQFLKKTLGSGSQGTWQLKKMLDFDPSNSHYDPNPGSKPTFSMGQRLCIASTKYCVTNLDYLRLVFFFF